MSVLLYLAAIVAANMSVYYLGPMSTVFNAFVLIALDLTMRDMLHERWHGSNLKAKMAALIAAGSVLTWILNQDAARVAVASCVAFATATTADTIAYMLLCRRRRLVRVNASNIVAAAVDSALFPTMAFGTVLWWVILGQFVAKTVGGYLWSLFFTKTIWREVPEGR